MVLAAMVVSSIYQQNGYTCVITSANDSVHKPGSLHYHGLALDFRTKNIDQFYATSKTLLVASVSKALGPDFQILLEAAGTDNEHMHVEYDPK